jgi:DNA-binding CsgD family transcriptional regulator
VAEVAAPAREPATAEGPDGSLALIVVDDDCQCLEANLGACRLFGMNRDEVLGQTLGEFLALEARESFHHVWLAFRAEGGHAGPFLLNGGTPVEVSVSVTADVVPSRHLLVLTPEGAARTRDGEPEPRVATGNRVGPVERRRGPTLREREVLRLLATGATDGQIASLLELSPATVQTHVRNAKAKLGARTRAQAVALALQRGMIQAG